MKQYSDTELLALAEENQQKAREIKIHPGLWKDMRVDIFLVKKEN